MKLAVVGAHLTGLPLNGQLVERNAKLIRTSRTKNCYRFYALPGTVPPKPGMVRVAEATETGIEVEVWELGDAEFGTFVGLIPPPLGIGTLELEDGELVKGFICETYATNGALEITRFGGWRNYLKSKK
jgi:allophanate hydrolase